MGSHPKKNMLMKALGCTPFVEPDITVKGFLKDDIETYLADVVKANDEYLKTEKIDF